MLISNQNLMGMITRPAHSEFKQCVTPAGSEGQGTPPQKVEKHPGKARQQLMLALSSLRSGETKGPGRKRDEHII